MAHIGTLGSPLTFAGQATAQLLARRSDEPGEPAYFPTMDAVVAAVLGADIDLGVLTSETSRTACTDTAARILAGEPLFVVDEIVVPYHCMLLGKPGTALADIRHVGGHGSIRQCRRFLAESLPHAQVEMHEQNSVAAARDVLAGDGTHAVIGTAALGRELGLEVVAADVDDGAAGGWWALSAKPDRPEGADHAAVRVTGAEELEDATARARAHGLRLRTVTNQPTGELFRYGYLMTLRSERGPIAAAVLDDFGPALVGAFTTSTAH
ncbi:prephenate dehydratase domain-containing protein [Dactylosporangium sp. NPDC005555]|uniref:prephenate dehydratase domain-containing protein n=1 Tax=Dactylosporangium sp. NPDC005555 TaxID=3154889 RepID=UPI00339EA316